MTRQETTRASGVEIDVSVDAGAWPEASDLDLLVAQCVEAVLGPLPPGQPVELSVVFTDDEAIRALNAQWRGKDKATNVLSFPAFQLRVGDPLPPMLGDIVLGWETVSREAELEGKPLRHHISHLVCHGLLHLLGHDHEDDADAEAMEELERRALASLAIPDPYA